MSRRKSCILQLIAGIAILTIGIGCGDNQSSAGDPGISGRNSGVDKAALFSIPSEQLSHIQILTVAPAPLMRTLRLTGAVAYNGFATTPVITQVSGPVSRIVVAPGENVRAGQPLLYVASPDFSQMRATYIKANDAFKLADREYARAKDLYDHHAIAEKDLIAAESARNQAEADLQASEQALHVLGFKSPDQAVQTRGSPELPVLAPIAGEVVERLVAPGQVIQAGTTQAFTISNMSTVWVLANVYQQDLPYVRVGDPVTILTDSYPGTEFHGKISYVAAALDPMTRTLQARIDVKNPQEKLKNNMYVIAQVEAGKVANAISVPNAAVLRNSENEPFVYTLAGQNQFAMRSVTIGQTSEQSTEITSGLAQGDRIVANGSLFLQFANSLQR
ncbi:MAG TPA: efflux RND transporter periplasmic adaptor subunit [Candidatus Sulfotelmatobacter sp.]|nr:efflux RND transporter periplasmic adaptor subunit [Candidatus Sulfotelmatobacter sp.]